MEKSEKETEIDTRFEEQLEGLLENKKLAAILLSFLDLRFIYEILDLKTPKELALRYRCQKGDEVRGLLSEPLRKIFIKWQLCKKQMKTDRCPRLEKETQLLGLLFENVVHGAYEIPWENRFEIDDNWRVIVCRKPEEK